MCNGAGEVLVSPAYCDGQIHDEQYQPCLCLKVEDNICPDCGGEIEQGQTKCYRYPCYLPA